MMLLFNPTPVTKADNPLRFIQNFPSLRLNLRTNALLKNSQFNVIFTQVAPNHTNPHTGPTPARLPNYILGSFDSNLANQSLNVSKFSSLILIPLFPSIFEPLTCIP